MKIRREIFFTILCISIAVLIMSATAGFFQLVNLRQSIASVHHTQSDMLIGANLDVLTNFNEEMVTALSQIYADSLENKLAAKVSQLLSVRNYLQDAYAIGLPSHSRFDDSLVSLRHGISFTDIEEEFRIIQSVRDLIRNIHETGTMSWLYYASESGMLIESEYTHYYGFDFRTRDWYVGAVQSGGVYWSAVYVCARTGQLAICVSVPVYGPQGQLMGVVGNDLLLPQLISEVLSVDTDLIKFTFFLNQDGEFILGSLPGRDHEYFIPNSAVRAALHADIAEQSNGLFSYGDTIVGFALVPSTAWYVGVLVDYYRISRPIMQIDEAIGNFGQYFDQYLNNAIRAATFISIGIAAFIILLGLIISRIVAKSLTRPIEILADGVSKVSAGDLEYKIEVKSGNELEILADSFNIMTTSLRRHIENMLEMRMENERISTELDIARDIQHNMLPGIFPAFPERDEFELYAMMEPAKEVGGDFYDFFLIDDNRLCLVIADVSGKGVPAALFMVIAKTLINIHARGGNEAHDIFTKVNNQLCEGNETSMFVTAWIGILEISTGMLTYVNAGHNPPFIKRENSDFERLVSKKAFMLAAMEDYEYTQATTLLKKGDTLYLYTDGVVEAHNPNQEEYGEARLKQVLNANASLSPKELLIAIKESIGTFAAGEPQFDDITMLALEIRKE